MCHTLKWREIWCKVGLYGHIVFHLVVGEGDGVVYDGIEVACGKVFLEVCHAFGALYDLIYAAYRFDVPLCNVVNGLKGKVYVQFFHEFL